MVVLYSHYVWKDGRNEYVYSTIRQYTIITKKDKDNFTLQLKVKNVGDNFKMTMIICCAVSIYIKVDMSTKCW